jgi:hypothetical protein
MQSVLNNLAKLPLVVTWLFCLEEWGSKARKFTFVITLLFISSFFPNLLAYSQSTSFIWIAAEQEIRKIAPDGTTLASITSPFGKPFQYTVAGIPEVMDINKSDGCVWVTDVNSDRILKISSNGVPLFEKTLWSPIGVAVDPSDGSTWTSVINTADPYTRAVIKLDSNGEILVTVTGFSSFIPAISLGESGSIWVSDRWNNQVVKLFGSDDELDGYDASSLTGSNHARFDGFSEPWDLSINLNDDSQGTGNVWIADRNNDEVVKLSPQGVELVRINPSSISNIRHVSVNPVDGSVWTFHVWGDVANISATGDELVNFPGDQITALDVNPANDTLWVGVGITSEAVAKKLDYLGTELLTVSMSEKIMDIAIHFGIIINVPTPEYPTIQAGIDAASDGDIVVVADGTYTGLGNKNLDFGGKNITVRSQNGPNNTIIDCEDDGRGFNIYGGEAAEISGITITNGYSQRGGGISTSNESTTISNCVITNCSATSGGGIQSTNSDLTIYNSTISGNTADSGAGGGMLNAGSSVTIVYCTFIDNYGYQAGGGIRASTSTITITKTNFSENDSYVAYLGAGGIDVVDTELTITDSTFSYNVGGAGGAIYIENHSLLSIANSIFTNNTAGQPGSRGGAIYIDESTGVITNSIFEGNVTDTDLGGAIGSRYYSSLTITNSTFVGNEGDGENNAIINFFESSANITNSIFWGDDSLSGDKQIVNDETSSSTVSYSNVDQDGFAGTNGNIREDPLFFNMGYWSGYYYTDWVEGDYHLTPDSPCIDVGIDAGVYDDMDGDFRPQGAGYDIGADEYVSSPAGVDTIGLYDGSTAWVHLRNSHTTGAADIEFFYGPGANNWVPVTGDWNGDGVDTIGLYDQATAMFHLINSHTTGVADIAFYFGPGGTNWKPIVGDWDGDGIDTIGLYDASSAWVHLRNSNTTGGADISFFYGPGANNWIPVTGDWNGDGVDTIGLYNQATAMFHLRNSHTTGFADIAFYFGPGGTNWKPITGDWDDDGDDSIGLYDASSAWVHLRNSNTTGGADISFFYGPGANNWIPVAGDWNNL